MPDLILPPSYAITPGRRAGRPFLSRTPLGMLLAQRGITIQQLAAGTHLSRRTIEWISSGNATGQFGIRSVVIIARHLHVAPSDILTQDQRLMLGLDR